MAADEGKPEKSPALFAETLNEFEIVTVELGGESESESDISVKRSIV